ncbi:MAG: hypothetical protein SNJ56_06680, partial [Termitinemataceae bacterium]
MKELANKLCILCALFALLTVQHIRGAVVFDSLDLSSQGRLLFTAQVSENGAVNQKGLFVADLAKATLHSLTLFPQQMDILDEGRIVQVRNSFGTFRISAQTGSLPGTLRYFPSFSDGAPIQAGRIDHIAPSRDGKWILSIEPTSAAYGNLVLIEVATGKRILITNQIERPGNQFPASWSNDSRGFIYAKNKKLFYHTFTTLQTNVDERFRYIGEGAISSIYWGKAGDFFYIKGSTVYHVRSADLFARTIYSDFIDIGTIAGSLPFLFDDSFDQFWVQPDSKAVMICKFGRTLFYIPLHQTYDTDLVEQPVLSFPFFPLPPGSVEIQFLWSASGLLTLWGTKANSDSILFAYRLDVSKPQYSIVSLKLPPVTRGLLSPD